MGRRRKSQNPFEGRAGRLADDASRKPAGRHSRSVDQGRKPKVGTKAKPKDAASDESRRLGSKARLEGQSKAQAGDWQESGAGRLIAGESLRSVGRWAGDRQAAQVAGRSKGEAGGLIGDESRKIDQKIELEGWLKAQAGDRSEGQSENLTADESWRLSWKATLEIDRRRKSEVDR